MTRLAVASITLTVAATFVAVAAWRWAIEKPVQWAGPLTGGAR